MSESKMIGIGPCAGHRGLFKFDPDTVITVLIDPETGRPPDVDEDVNHIDSPDPRAVARTIRMPLCPDCLELVNADRVERGLSPVYPRS